MIGVSQEVLCTAFGEFRRDIHHNSALKGDEFHVSCSVIEGNQHYAVGPSDIMGIGKFFIRTQEEDIHDVFVFRKRFCSRKVDVFKLQVFCTQLFSFFGFGECRREGLEKQDDAKHNKKDFFLFFS